MDKYFCELRKGDWYYYITDDYFTAKEVDSVEVEEDRVIVNGIILPKKTKSYCTNCETYTTDILLIENQLLELKELIGFKVEYYGMLEKSVKIGLENCKYMKKEFFNGGKIDEDN